MLNLVLFGPPGAGKGTQSEKLIAKYNLIHLSTGDLLRSQIAAGTELGLRAKQLMDQGLLVPDEVVIGMIGHKLRENQSALGFIFDGFPRTVPQAEALDQLLAQYNTQITTMIALVVEDEELIRRLLKRGETSGRPDDQNDELIRRRVLEYNSKTKPVADYYGQQGKYTAIDGIGDIDTIFGGICKELEKSDQKAD
ncbi:adenylate kinase [Spirosoma utsteinense]|uniref:Adenylate kinase n=1 Tax=Spirosoma utsteinense TaxID=2585773 RepID=A0ABR6W929_9BACT|nr:adenylate kinase [Spirosoma utsteinense]MBC3784857.1 adenylate kinase [Spirosoma utsteinense]MBC3792417.1 adenylate kinase [Spirosoma utsteinense]